MSYRQTFFLHFLKTYFNENVNTKINNTDLDQKHSKLFVLHGGQGCLVFVASRLARSSL